MKPHLYLGHSQVAKQLTLVPHWVHFVGINQGHTERSPLVSSAQTSSHMWPGLRSSVDGPLAVGDDAPPVILNYLQWWSGYPLAESLCQGRGRHIELTTPACLIFIYHSCETAFLHPTLSFKYLCSTSLHRQQWWHLASLALFFLMQKRRHYWLFQASLAGLLLGYWILQSTENTSLCGEKSRRPWVSKLYQLRAHRNNLLLL